MLSDQTPQDPVIDGVLFFLERAGTHFLWQLSLKLWLWRNCGNAACIPKWGWPLLYLFLQPCRGQLPFQSPADQAESLSACIWAVGRKRPPLCRGCAPATPRPG